jgi:hypothetical protein
VELYNLKEDISEEHDLSARFPEKADSLRKSLNEWEKSIMARRPVINPDYIPWPGRAVPGRKD